jgi:hypothetical protein
VSKSATAIALPKIQEKETSMQTSKLNLDQSLHLRINKQFGEKLESIAFQNGMKTSALARFILTKHLHEISLPSNLPAWMR